MQVNCVARLEAATGERGFINAVEQFPDAGTRFTFKPADGVAPRPGVYRIDGNLAIADVISDKSGTAKRFTLASVTGTAYPLNQSDAEAMVRALLGGSVPANGQPAKAGARS